jgi:uncharacterized Zn finger protein
MDREYLRILLKNLQSLMRCPNCGHRYTIDEIKLRGQNGPTIHLQLLCQECGAPVSASVAISGNLNNMAAAPQIQEIKPVKKSHKPISSNEIIELHEYLKDFDGNFDSI